MTLTYSNGIAIGEIVCYSPCLLVAVFLMARHGLRKAGGWYFLVMFSLVRILGAVFQLATINDPTSVSLRTGAAILTTVGFSALLLATLGLLTRLIHSIEKTGTTVNATRHIKIIEIVLFAGLIVGIIGGINAGKEASKPPYKYQPGTLSKVGTALFVACYAATVVATILTSLHTNSAELGEQRIIYTIFFSLPFLLVRLVYTLLSTFSHDKHFSLLGGSPTIILCVAIIEELIVTITYLAIGLTLAVVPKVVEGAYKHARENSESAEVPKKDNILLSTAKRSIIGRIVMSTTSRRQDDVEMHTQTGYGGK
jgi:uncharacterized membrane protein